MKNEKKKKKTVSCLETTWINEVNWKECEVKLNKINCVIKIS